MLKAFIFCALTIALFGACNKEEDTAKVEIRLTDAPVAVDEVNVDVREVRVKFSDDTSANNGWVNLTTNAGVYNLLALQNGVDTLLASASLPQQTIKEIRLILGPDNSVTDNGISYPLVIPSGSESGLKIKVNKKLNATLNTLVIDFDAALSLKKEGPGDYKLRPVLKIK
jgi:hypothetical protein